MNYDNFEGFKKIENHRKYNLEQIYEVIKKYQNELGEVKYRAKDDDLKIVVDVDGKYYVDIYLKNNCIVIERKLEYGAVEDTEKLLGNSKSKSLAHADRMIEQLYDLLKEFVTTGEITEYITKVNKILYVSENKQKVLKGALSLGKSFEVRDEDNKVLYYISQNIVNKIFSIKNMETKREEGCLSYREKDENKFSILKSPYECIELTKDKNSIKTKFFSNDVKHQLDIEADFTDNHYLVEFNKLVIGSIDCLDPVLKREYKVEVNNLEYIYILLSTIALIDIDSSIDL